MAELAADDGATSARCDPRVDGQGIVVVDVACTACGYNVRAASRQGTCAECGQSVARTLQQTNMHMADPRWLETMASGMRWLAMTAVLTPLFLVAYPLASALGVMGLVGIWKLTNPEPGIAASHVTSRDSRLRCWVRWGFITAVGLTGLLAGISALVLPMMRFTYDGEPFILAGIVASFGVLALWLAMFILFGIYTRHLARRMGRGRLVKQTTFVLWIGVAATVVFTLGVLVLISINIWGAFAGPVFPFTTGILVALTVVATIYLLAALLAGTYYIWGTVLLFWYDRCLRRELGNVVLVRKSEDGEM